MPNVRHLTAVGTAPLRVAEFFAGVGLARIGLERAGFRVVWANDFSADKQSMYQGHFGADSQLHTFINGDVATVHGEAMPDIEMAWSSFPCTDLSLAGNMEGLAGKHSSTFFEFTRILEEMGERKPRTVALENVTALASSHGGEDLAAAVRELNRLGYSVDVLSLDARRFVPQSRPRLFLVATMDPPEDCPEPNSELRPDWLQTVFGDPSLTTHRAALPAPPAPLTAGLAGYVEHLPIKDDRWWEATRVTAFLGSLSPAQSSRVETLRRGRTITYRTAYRRTRAGKPVWEVRPDDISGCLRTARGGSSRQALVRAGRGQIQIRWMTPREYARLMGAGDYRLDGLRDLQALFGFGDAVCVDAVGWLATNYLEPLLRGTLALAQQPMLQLAYGLQRHRIAE